MVAITDRGYGRAGPEPVMSSDFSIKPAGSPGAAVAQPVSTATDDGVATDLPAHQSVADAGSIVFQVVDNRTSLVVRQFPDQQSLRRRAYARALEQAREAALALKVDRKI
ncbi:MAG: hypothetical protein QOH32_2177 [Bradyrhizobium sp.]|jgi:hypothetical protein|nr:hypothetical protein [Bradyrhizobium sp.]